MGHYNQFNNRLMIAVKNRVAPLRGARNKVRLIPNERVAVRERVLAWVRSRYRAIARN